VTVVTTFYEGLRAVEYNAIRSFVETFTPIMRVLSETYVDQATELLARAKSGDEKAFDLLVERATPHLYRIVRRMSSDRMEAEGIVQETWLRAWKALHRVKADRPVMPWLATIAVNLARDQWRQSKRLQVEAEPGPVWEPGISRPAERQMIQQDDARQLAQYVSQLRPEYRAVIALRYDAGLSYEEIAKALSTPINTVRTHLRRAKQALRQRMEAENG
jgi:RNA polymerase sigma-70 factor (ECF subfamily)